MARSNAQASVFIERIERRHSPRTDLLVRVNYQTVDALFSEFARNINEGGMFIETEDPQPVGTRVELEFKLPGSEDPLKVTGLVVRSDVVGPEGSQGMGIEFESLAETERDHINLIVRKLRSPA
jgi:type IV pilus assembly protein PilZ